MRMSASLQGKTLVLSRGSSGFGLQVAQFAGDKGARLIIVGRNG
jgi:short-subunit dehydrogenase involved in D-alanine esterification of teichoic acids